MKSNFSIYFFKVLLVNILLVSCAFIPGMIPATATPTSTITATYTPQATATIKITTTPYYPVRGGEFIILPSGGFEFAGIRGYKIIGQDSLGVYLKSTDNNVELVAVAYPRPKGAAVTRMITDWRESFAKQFSHINYSDIGTQKINGIEMSYNDFSGMKGDIPFQGRFAVYEPPNSKLVYLYVIAYGDQRWEREGQKVFDLSSKSVKVFKITPANNCPITKDTKYGLEKTNPIKIGGGTSEGAERIYEYLGVLLGLKGEIVSYAQSGSLTHEGKELQVVYIQVGNDLYPLYFDINAHEELLVPYKLNCSGPMPGKPTGPSL